MHDLDAGEQDCGAAKGLEPEHRPGNPFDGAVVLLDDIVQVLRLAHLDGQAAVGLNAQNDRCVRTALVDSDLLGHAVKVDGSFQECPRCSVISLGTKKEVDGVTVLVDRSVQVLPLAGDWPIPK